MAKQSTITDIIITYNLVSN